MNVSTAADLDRMEVNAKVQAARHVAKMLQRPDQLEKVDQYRRRVVRKKAAVEAMLKTAVQSQLDGVITGLNQLHTSLKDVKDIQTSLVEVDEIYQTTSEYGARLTKIRDENSRHSQLAAAVENMKHIFTVPEMVRKTEELIDDGKLLYAHKGLADLEQSRDDLLYELYKQPTKSPTDVNTVKHYFGEVERLSDLLAKQLSLILQRTLMTVRREPQIIVSCLRIIEREELKDEGHLKRQEQTGFLPPHRPKRWKKKCFDTFKGSVQSRIEGNQFEDRSSDKMWLVRHLEMTRQIVLEDLQVVKSLCTPVFPPHYDILDKYVQLYHDGLAEHLSDLIQQGLEGNEVVSLLNWLNTYTSKELMKHPSLNVDTSKLSPLLSEDTVKQLEVQYLQQIRANFKEWMANSLRSDIKDWHRDTPPEADGDGYFNTALPVILFQMIEQNIQVAATISRDLVNKVLNLCVQEMDTFARTYKAEVHSYKEKHFQDRSQPQFFINYMIANINNCRSMIEFTQQLKQRHSKEDLDESEGRDGFVAMAETFNRIARERCGYLLEEVFMDLEPHVQSLLTRQWLQSSNAIDTINITLEDYCQDFVHLKPQYFEMMLYDAQSKVLCEYLKALLGRKVTFKNYEERKMAAEKICREADQLNSLFGRLSPNFSREAPFDVLPMLAEVIKLKDTSMMSLELSSIIEKYPDLRQEQVVNLLSIRGDVGRGDARQLVQESLGEEDPNRPRPKGIFSALVTT
ncbi:unnamed protein product [Owenia fusiformis]|uniref:Uncharacterized protein n=1 Tax=Owenia fusiformis TaxID=6347 RepID=A0A8J1UV51_OWEFU|nr:unnamed protein product [Owenia fusiformis]